MSPLRKHLPVRAWIALLIAVTSPAPGTAGENLLFTGTLVTPPACTVSDKGGRINVDFATNIAIEKIDGDQYRQMIPYQIDCPGNDPSRGSWRLKMTLRATDTGFDSAAVQTSIADLGIRILLNGTPFILNEPRPVEMGGASEPPRLEAVPVKKIGASLPQTRFTASALLIAELY